MGRGAFTLMHRMKQWSTIRMAWIQTRSGKKQPKYTDEDEVAEAAQKAGYTDIFKRA